MRAGEVGPCVHPIKTMPKMESTDSYGPQNTRRGWSWHNAGTALARRSTNLPITFRTHRLHLPS